VWPGLNVEESSLRVHVAALRRALGDGIGATRHIVNVAGRGYCFVASVAFDEFNPIRLPRTLIEDACALANAQGMSVDQFFSSLITDRIDALKALPRTRRRIGGP
jgi:DNA-binding winged helix-turn-helix (wHTH) protein